MLISYCAWGQSRMSVESNISVIKHNSTFNLIFFFQFVYVFNTMGHAVVPIQCINILNQHFKIQI